MTETEKNHSFQRVQLMKQAAVIRQNNGMNRHDALVTAHRIGALIRQMHHRIYPNRKIRSLSTMISKPKAGAPFTLKIFWISKRTGKTATSKNESAKERNERAGTKRMGGALQTV